MKTGIVRIYGFSGNEVVRTAWFYNNQVSDERLELVARNMKATYGCDHVWAMMDSNELHDSWLVYIKSANLRNGLAEFAKAEFRDYVESGDCELAIG